VALCSCKNRKESLNGRVETRLELWRRAAKKIKHNGLKYPNIKRDGALIC